MTKRDTQAREYAAESYEKTPAKRGVSHTDWAFTDAEISAVRFFATYGAPAHRANTLRKLLERMK